MKPILLITTALLLVSCSNSSRPKAEVKKSKPSVFVTNYPLQYFAQRIGGDLLDVHFPAPRDVDPAFWEPDAATIENYQNADLILLNGASYEKWVERASLPASKVVNTSAAFKGQYLPLGETVTHSHGPEGKHSHSGTAFTTWLNPVLAQEQAKAIHQALRKVLPDRGDVLDRNQASLASDLASLDRQLQGYKGGPLIASHPVYQYIARRYMWDLQSLHWEPNEAPSPEEWKKLETMLKTHHAKVMIWEAPPLPETEQRLKKLGITPVPFYPCANVPEQGDYLSVMRQNAERLR